MPDATPGNVWPRIVRASADIALKSSTKLRVHSMKAKSDDITHNTNDHRSAAVQDQLVAGKSSARLRLRCVGPFSLLLCDSWLVSLQCGDIGEKILQTQADAVGTAAWFQCSVDSPVSIRSRPREIYAFENSCCNSSIFSQQVWLRVVSCLLVHPTFLNLMPIDAQVSAMSGRQKLQRSMLTAKNTVQAMSF